MNTNARTRRRGIRISSRIERGSVGQCHDELGGMNTNARRRRRTRTRTDTSTSTSTKRKDEDV